MRIPLSRAHATDETRSAALSAIGSVPPAGARAIHGKAA
jgi:hypothetical protein